jgi:hypothetical protein
MRGGSDSRSAPLLAKKKKKKCRNETTDVSAPCGLSNSPRNPRVRRANREGEGVERTRNHAEFGVR